MKILLVCTRGVTPPMTGRKMVLRTIVESLSALGHEVELAVVGKPESRASMLTVPVHTITPPGLPTLGWHAATRFTRGAWSLNECAFVHRKGLREVRELADRFDPDLVVADMIRTAPYALATGRPWVLDFDDVLSERYATLAASNQAAHGLLGYYGPRIPRPLHALTNALIPRVLKHEARVLARREEHFGRLADAATAVSKLEAGRLGTRTRRTVFASPMSMPPPPRLAGLQRSTRNVIFLGGMDYLPNLTAVRYFAEHVLPLLQREGSEVGSIGLKVVGRADDASGRRVTLPGVDYLGYVDDLSSILQGHRIFVAPLQSGSGIKTKVLEAMAHGMVVVGTPVAFDGMPIVAGREAVVVDSPVAMAAAIRHLTSDETEATRISGAAREFVADNFAPAVLRERWAAIVEAALAARLPDARPAEAVLA